MVRRIKMDEASANFEGIVEAALANGDSLEFERDGQVIGIFRPAAPLPSKGKVVLGDFLRELHAMIPDEDFAKDVQWAIDNQGSVDFTDPWEKYGDAPGHQRADSDGEAARRGSDHAA